VSEHRPRLLLATSSADKIREYRQILRDLPLELVTPADLGLRLEVEESGTTFQENALIKARAYWDATGQACLAEDSGFEVDALGGAPGVQSARWEGDDYQHKNQLVMDLVGERTGLARRCRYVCTIALVDPTGRIHQAIGTLTGRVARRPAGEHGFGYDPIFELPRLRRTLAELPPELKDTISHRARAARRVRPALVRTVLGPGSSGCTGG
jgi:XTP/dITP diphosphohydrolase